MAKPINKRILLVCKETYSYPLYYLAKIWSKENTVAAFFGNAMESSLKECFLNDTTYYRYKKTDFIRVYDLNEASKKYTDNYKTERPDYQYLMDIEKKYTHYKGLNLQILTSQYFTRHYHFRNYMSMCTYDQQMLCIEYSYREIEKIVEDFKPDYLVDCDNEELSRSILSEICFLKKIPYLNIDHARYENYRLITFKNGYGIDNYIEKRYREIFDSDSDLLEEIDYIQQFRMRNKIMAKQYDGTITAQYEGDSYYTILKELYIKFNYFVRDQDRRGGGKDLKKKNPILYTNTKEYMKYYARVYIRRRLLLKRNKYFEFPVKGEKYVYMPLHLIPESTTFVKAPFYINELTLIEAVSKALPIGWYLYVKEHQSMLGERGYDFYKRIKKIPNVRLVQPNYYKDPKPWIQNAVGIVTITGTTAYEAALMGKPSLVFGDVNFNVIDGITRVYSFEEIPKLIKGFHQLDNKRSCAAYIKAVKELGEPIEFLKLLDDGFSIARGQIALTGEYEKEIEKLRKLYERYME